MRQAVMYARVSSKDQEREGFSIPAQQVLLRQYAAKQGFQIIHEFVDVETAKVAGRNAFGEMVAFLKRHRNCRVVLAGTHPLSLDSVVFQRVQDIFGSYNRPKHRHQEFAFGSGLLRCGYDDCLITAEIKKQRYIYYRCTFGRGKCGLPYFREEELSERLGGILKDIYVPDSVVRDIERSLASAKTSRKERLLTEEARLQKAPRRDPHSRGSSVSGSVRREDHFRILGAQECRVAAGGAAGSIRTRWAETGR